MNAQCQPKATCAYCGLPCTAAVESLYGIQPYCHYGNTLRSCNHSFCNAPSVEVVPGGAHVSSNHSKPCWHSLRLSESLSLAAKWYTKPQQNLPRCCGHNTALCPCFSEAAWHASNKRRSLCLTQLKHSVTIHSHFNATGSSCNSTLTTSGDVRLSAQP